MKTKPLIWLLPAAGAIIILLLAGRALTEKEKPLPPTGSELTPAPVVPASPLWESISVRQLEEALEDRDDAADILHFLRARQETGGTHPPAWRPPSPAGLSAPVRGELAEPRTATPAEPTIREVHLAAIRYAEVMPEKIRNWRILSQLRNFIPRFTLGLDRDSDTTIASSTSAGKTTFAVGPQDETLSVDFGFTWDLGNLVWDSAQTSIDSRSRLMVQLRQEILKETTQLYFERRRLQAEFDALPTDDPLLRRERALRLEELAAQLDALTGGLYSEKP